MKRSFLFSTTILAAAGMTIATATPEQSELVSTSGISIDHKERLRKLAAIDMIVEDLGVAIRTKAAQLDIDLDTGTPGTLFDQEQGVLDMDVLSEILFEQSWLEFTSQVDAGDIITALYGESLNIVRQTYGQPMVEFIDRYVHTGITDPVLARAVLQNVSPLKRTETRSPNLDVAGNQPEIVAGTNGAGSQEQVQHIPQ